MSTKRGRPQTSDSTTAEVAHRRDVWRRRQQSRRSRIAAQSAPVQQQPTHQQLQQGEQIVNLALTEEESAAVTLTQLGLRVQGVTLGRDVAGAQEQEQATAVDEHQTLYEDDNPPLDRRTTPSNGARVGFF